MKRKLGTFKNETDITTPLKKKMLPAKIQLTANELRLKSLLLEVAASVNSARQCQNDGQVQMHHGHGIPLVLRWAGGWVRDKLLGMDSHDIDVAINCMTGEMFGEELRRFCTRQPIIDKYSIHETDLGSLHTIKANPEKSKNLATATCRVFGVDLDFVNLRKETYADHSRHPEVEFGTPCEDALRRDATVNSLFYNIHTDQVEDFTGGLPDMAAKLIRTPLEPLQTFTDDPLRILRLVRFASRLQFRIDPEAERLMADSRVLKSLAVKISRERIGIEVEKMLKGKFPRDALGLIHRLGLYHVIFTDPASSDMPVPDIASWPISYQCLDMLAADHVGQSVYSRLVRTQEEAYFAWNLAALTPWANIYDPPLPSGKLKSQLIPFVTRAAREGVKAPNKLSDTISASHMHRVEILELKRATCRGDSAVRARDRLGLAIRKWDKLGGHWRLQVLYTLLVEAMETLRSESDMLSDDFKAFVAGWRKFLDHLDELGVMNAPEVKRLVDGRMLSQALGVKPGKWMGKALDVCLAWQLRNPGIEDVEGAIEEVRERRKQLEIPE